MSQKQTCPRRMSDWGPWERKENLDRWQFGSSFSNTKSEYEGVKLRSCNFCGSLHPDDFMALVEKGYIVGPTDKNYKVYLGKPNTEEYISSHPLVTEFEQRIPEHRRVMTEHGHTEAEQDEAVEKERKRVRELITSSDIGKFYTAHLSADQARRFWELYTTSQMKVGYPGYFYARIYLPIPKEDEADEADKAT